MNNLSHIAIIMDGNGRWAKEKKLPRTAGHKKGVENVREIAIHANKLGIKCLTLYAFSTENWKRSQKEVNFIMSLPEVFFNAYLKELMEENVKVMMIGRDDRIPKKTMKIFNKAIEETKNNTGLILNFAVNYGGRDEIIRAVKRFNEVDDIDNLDEDKLNDYLDTASLPELDLIIRTSGELRLSNFLLYQSAYSELYFTDKYWPDFSTQDLDEAISKYNNRKRNFGGIDEE